MIQGAAGKSGLWWVRGREIWAKEGCERWGRVICCITRDGKQGLGEV